MTAKPKLILGSFRGIGGVRIQTYTLNAPSPSARTVLIHGSRCHFASEFLSPDQNFLHNTCKNPDNFDLQSNHLNVPTKIDNNFLVDGKIKVIGQLKVESKTIDMYEDGTNGWDVQNTYSYDDSFCHILNNNNITVHGMDLRSYGRSESPDIFIAGRVRGLVDEYDILAADVVTYIENIKNQNSDGLPIYLLGFSMGGGVVSRVVELHKDKLVDGVILLSPMLSILSTKMERIINSTWFFHIIASKLFPKLPIASGDRSKETHPLERIREKDPLCINADIPYRTGYGMIKLIKCAQRESVKIYPDTSVLIMHSLSDVVCYYKGAEDFYNSLSQIKKKRLVTLNNIDHLILYPPLLSQIGKYVSDWILTGDSNVKLDYEHDTRNN